MSLFPGGALTLARKGRWPAFLRRLESKNRHLRNEINLIRHQQGDSRIQVASIGQAGENQVRMACIINNKSRAAGRAGLGAVMGSKNLKAIAVRGSGMVNAAHMDRLKTLTKEFSKKIKKEFSYTMMSEYGTQNFTMGTNVLGALVIHYQRINTLADATGICKFATKPLLQAVGIEDMLDFHTAVTGKEMDLTHFIRAADRIYGLERHMHAQEGVTRKDDLPIGKWINEPIQNGPFKGEWIDLKSPP